MEQQKDPNILDDAAAMARADSGGMLGYVAEFSDQIAEGWRISRDLELTGEAPGSVVILGMGGSAIGGDLVKGIWADRISVPVEVIRGYDLPAWVGTDTLVIASSKSGNTEETLSALETALARRCPVVVVSTGGALKSVAQAAGLPLATFPDRGSPRSSVGWSMAIVAGILQKAGVLDRDRRCCRARHGRALRAGRGHCRQPCQAAGLVVGRSLRHRHRQRLPGAGGTTLEGPVQREQQGHRSL